MTTINIQTLKFPQNRHFLKPIVTALSFFRGRKSL